jgi:hypothetical protein
MRNGYKFWLENLKDEDNFEDKVVYTRKILNGFLIHRVGECGLDASGSG